MSDLERQLEELFMSDSRSRRVDQVNVAARRGNRLAPFGFVGAVALATLALILAFSFLRGGDTVPASSPSPSGSAAAVASGSAAPSGSASPNATPSTSTGPAQAPKPDAKHGLITFDAIRTEDSATNLQQPPQFARTGTGGTDFKVAVSPDGKRVAMFRAGQTGQQLITFTTARPNDVTVYPQNALTGSELAVDIVWSGDNSDNIVYSVDDRPTPTTVTYSAVRSYDLAAQKASEITRASGVHLMPLAWRADTHIGGLVEVVVPTGSVGSYYVIDGNALTNKTPLAGQHFTDLSASRDGARIVVPHSPAIRWWPVDQPSAAKEILPQSNGRAEYAAFRPGTDEIGVSVLAPCAGCGVPPPGHFEIWNVTTGAQRVVSPTAGFQFWRTDGSAAIQGATLVDPDTGGTTPLPGTFKTVAVVAF